MRNIITLLFNLIYYFPFFFNFSLNNIENLNKYNYDYNLFLILLFSLINFIKKKEFGLIKKKFFFS